jgi:hypothetical protein
MLTVKLFYLHWSKSKCFNGRKVILFSILKKTNDCKIESLFLLSLKPENTIAFSPQKNDSIVKKSHQYLLFYLFNFKLI